MMNGIVMNIINRFDISIERIERSEILPDLDINLLAECLSNSNPLAAAKEFRQRLRSQFGKD